MPRLVLQPCRSAAGGRVKSPALRTAGVPAVKLGSQPPSRRGARNHQTPRPSPLGGCPARGWPRHAPKALPLLPVGRPRPRGGHAHRPGDVAPGPGRLGRLTRQGPAVVRPRWTDAAWQRVRRAPTRGGGRSPRWRPPPTWRASGTRCGARTKPGGRRRSPRGRTRVEEGAGSVHRTPSGALAHRARRRDWGRSNYVA